MAERLTVTIPEELHKRLQFVKADLNISQICQAALDRAITIEELKKGELPEMTKLAERLKLEKIQADEEWRETGILQGKEDALEFSYEDFRILEKTKKIDENYIEYLNNKVIAFLENPNEEQFLSGWIEGVLSVWDQVKDTL